MSAIDVTKNTQLTFVPTYKLGNEATLVYEFVIKPIEGDLDEHEISAGVVIKWKKDKLKVKNIGCLSCFEKQITKWKCFPVNQTVFRLV